VFQLQQFTLTNEKLAALERVTGVQAPLSVPLPRVMASSRQL
jgi:hypothetical protein